MSKPTAPIRFLMGITVFVPTVLVLASVPGFGSGDNSIVDAEPVPQLLDEHGSGDEMSVLESPDSPVNQDLALVSESQITQPVPTEDIVPTQPESLASGLSTSSTAPSPSSTTPRQAKSSTPPSPTSAAPPQTTSPDSKSTSSPSQLVDSGPITVSGKDGLTIENMSVSNPDGACIRVIDSSNVTIKNSTIGPCGDWGVFIDRSSKVTVQNSTIRTGSVKGGVYGHSSSAIAVLGNDISNSGRNPVQFDKVTGTGNRIESNAISSNSSEDMISVYKSGGTSGSWLSVRGNTVHDNTGKSNTGSGILVGDAGGSYILVQGNKLTDPGQAGIGVAGGSNIRVLDNNVKSAQFLWSNVGIYVWDQYNSSCNNIEVRGNTVDWINKTGQSNPAWNGGGCGTIAGWDSNSW